MSPSRASVLLTVRPSPRYPSTMRKLELSICLFCTAVLAPCVLPAQQRAQFSASQFAPEVVKVGHADGPAVESKAAEGSLLLTADPYHAPVLLSPAGFRALPHVTITVHNSHTNATETYSGVPLATLLAQVNAPLGKELHGEAMTSFVVATGSDGYSVVLSLAEVDPSFHEGQVLVADTRDGQPLANYGPFQLIVSDDKRPARWVHNLVSITLQHAH
jgi:hypothetical protein